MPAPPALHRVPVYYDPRLVAQANSHSPSAGKPGLVVASWQERKLPIEIVGFEPASREQLKAAHHPSYVDGVLACRIENGFGNQLANVALSLPYTSGAMLHAAHAAIANRIGAVAPVAGFHHARYDAAAGFCTFNGLIVAAQAVRAAIPAAQVGILDFDMHYGDGSDDIIRRRKLDWIVHYTAGREYHDESQAPGFLEKIPRLLQRFANCAVLLYQAGADPHIADPHGGFLTTRELTRRDQLVFSTARQMQLPLAWNLAGGYQQPIRKVLDIHDNTMVACIDAWLA